jgi:hypothetical protein
MAFQVDDVDEWMKRLGDVKIDSGPRNTQPFPVAPNRCGRVVWILDPAGERGGTERGLHR